MKRLTVPITAILSIITVLALAATAMAQSPAIDNLVVQIWPEYDRPETLIIYQGQLVADASLPTTLTFEIPARVETMHAVAIMSTEGRLVNVEYTLTPKDASTQILTFNVDSPRFQFEYYDPDVVLKDGQTRSLSYAGQISLPVKTLQVEIQQPIGAEGMEMTPPADEVMTGSNTFTYFIYKKTDVSPGEFINLSGKYTKKTDELTADAQIQIVQPTPASAPEPLSAAMPGNNWAVTLGYVLVGLGAGVLLVAAGIWIFNNNRTVAEEVPPRRPPRRKGSPPAPKPVNPTGTSAGETSKFCPQCGARYKPGAKFCHQCGAPRR